MSRKVIIMGAGGRDFHNFNMLYKDDADFEVVAFTATQIPFIEKRTYPSELAGRLYPAGIPIISESGLEALISELKADLVVLAYSDISYEYVMHRASACLAVGADFLFLGPGETMLPCSVPVISVCAVRTGCGKSIITRNLALCLKQRGLRVSVIRHPMAYCDFIPAKKFSSMADIDRAACTIEEREELEHLVHRGITVFMGIDYRIILDEAQAQSQVIIWDGGNNDFSFIKPNLEIVLLDALRPGHEILYYPGEVNLLRGSLLIITKVNEARPGDIEAIRDVISKKNPGAAVLEAPSILTVSDPELMRGKKVLVIEDGPTITHGGMPYGAGVSACRGIVSGYADPRPFAVGSIKDTYAKYPHIGPVLPAMGYSEAQRRELAETISRTPFDVAVIATPVDLRRIVQMDKPAVRVSYDFDIDLEEYIDSFITANNI
jgi:predicted GTPase